MKARASAVSILLAIASCGVGPPAYELEEESTATGSIDSSSDVEISGGPRVLSDVSPPRRTDARSSGPAGASTVVDANERSVEAGLDASARGARNSSDSSSNEVGRDAPSGKVDDAKRESAPVSEGARDSNLDECDVCSIGTHLLITELATRPSGAEMIEILNPTSAPIALHDYLLSDSHLYYKVATDSFTTASGSDFAARFPEGASLEPAQYIVVALANASGGSASFEATYGRKPDFELRPTANGAIDDAIVPNMQPAQAGSSIGATSSLTDSGEPIVLFFFREGARVFDVDYLFYGAPSASNPVVDKTGIDFGGEIYAADTPAALQHPVAAPEIGSLHRCRHDEPNEKRAGGNGLAGHDETSENVALSFVAALAAEDRTPGGPPPPRLCSP